nr:hypothetical protein [Tanacetum cinerariifolium]
NINVASRIVEDMSGDTLDDALFEKYKRFNCFKCQEYEGIEDFICDKDGVTCSWNEILFNCFKSQEYEGIEDFICDKDEILLPVAADFNARDYATLVAHPPFVLEVSRDIDLFAFIHALDPTKVRVVERERNKDGLPLLETTIGCTVPLLPVVPDRADSELDASVERLFGKGGSDTVVEDMAPVQPKRILKRKYVAADAGEASHPPKKLREDHETLSVTSVGTKSISAIKRLLVGAVLNAEVRVAAIPTLPFVTSFVSTTLEREGGDHTDSVVASNLRTISALKVMTVVTTVTSTVEPALVVKEKHVKPSLFYADSSSAGRADPNTGIFSDLTGSDFLVDGICTVIDPDTDLQKVYMKHDQLFTEFNVGAARQVCLSAEVRMHAEEEKRRLNSEVEKHNELLKVGED